MAYWDAHVHETPYWCDDAPTEHCECGEELTETAEQERGECDACHEALTRAIDNLETLKDEIDAAKRAADSLISDLACLRYARSRDKETLKASVNQAHKELSRAMDSMTEL